MDFETTNWKAEARRVTAAFGIEEECRFVESRSENPARVARQLRSRVTVNWPILPSGYSLIYTHSQNDLHVVVGRVDELAQWTILAHLELDNEGRLLDSDYEGASGVGLDLARSLHHLDLLTEEIEAALKVTVSAHQKIEWAREFEQRRRVKRVSKPRVRSGEVGNS